MSKAILFFLFICFTYYSKYCKLLNNFCFQEHVRKSDEEKQNLKRTSYINSLLKSIEHFEKEIDCCDISPLTFRNQKLRIQKQEIHIDNLLKILTLLQSTLSSLKTSNWRKEGQISRLKHLSSELGMEIIEEDILILDSYI